VSASVPATEQTDQGPSTPPGAHQFGPNSAEVAAFIDALGGLSAAQWRKVVSTRRSVAGVTRGDAAPPAEIVRAMLRGEDGAGGPLPGPLSSVARAVASRLEGRSDDEVVAAWQAVSALLRRRQLSALTFAAHYMPFGSVIPPAVADDPTPAVELFGKALRWLSPAQWEILSQPWSLDRESSASLLQAAMKSRGREAEEATALAALAIVPKHLSGDAGWAAVKTAVHGGRVLGCQAELTPEQQVALWAPLEPAIALRSLGVTPSSEKPERKRAKREPTPPKEAQVPEEAGAGPALAPKRAPARRSPAYGPNSAEVAAFVKAIPELTSIQWLRVLDRRQLVASVTREGSAEPAAVVRSLLAAINVTRDLEVDARCTVLMAVERAAFALESKDRLSADQALQHYGAFAEVVPFGEVEAAALPDRVAALNPEELVRLVSSAAAADVAAVSPVLNAGSALADHLAQRSDDEVVVTWQALNALLRRHRLSPIKFAVSYAPFASAVPVIKTKAIAPPVQKYLTAIGRMSAHQCAVLGEPWLLPDDVSNVLSKAVIDGSAKLAEEAAALAALVTVPMRLTGNAGWAAAKTAVYGGRVIASRAKFTDHEFRELWKPLERAIPIASIEAPAKSKS
jgi:hypothetical protein